MFYDIFVIAHFTFCEVRLRCNVYNWLNVVISAYRFCWQHFSSGYRLNDIVVISILITVCYDAKQQSYVANDISIYSVFPDIQNIYFVYPKWLFWISRIDDLFWISEKSFSDRWINSFWYLKWFSWISGELYSIMDIRNTFFRYQKLFSEYPVTISDSWNNVLYSWLK